MDERYINNGGKLVDYFCDYLERHIGEITDEISLREEFEDMWPITKDYIKPEYMVSDEDAFRMFKHAFGIINEEQQDMTKSINEESINLNNIDSSIVFPMSMLRDVFTDEQDYWDLAGGDGAFNENMPYFITDGVTFARSLTADMIRKINSRLTPEDIKKDGKLHKYNPEKDGQPVCNSSEYHLSKRNDNIDEATIRNIVSENLKKMLKEYGETPQGLGKVAKNTDRRATQMKKSPEDTTAIDKSFEAERYLAQAIQNALEAGMSDEQIQSVLQKNMRKNYNPKFGNGTLKYGKK